MNEKLLPIILSGVALASTIGTVHAADTTNKLYGKAVMSLQSHEEDASGSQESAWKLATHASRIGVKGDIKIDDDLKVIYKAEYEIYLDDGDDGKGFKSEFKQRNTFLGLKAGWGTVFAGVHDTPLKIAQGKIDKFNDITDMKIVLDGENRMSNVLQYSSPKFGGGFTANVMTMLGEDNDPTADEGGLTDHISASLTYKTKQVWAAIAMDDDVKGMDIMRLAAEYNSGKFTVGAVYQDSEASTGGASDDGIIVSASAKAGSGYTVKAQFGTSDQKIAGGDMFSLGVDKKLGKKTKVFAYYTAVGATASTDEETIFGFGVQHKFSSKL